MSWSTISLLKLLPFYQKNHRQFFYCPGIFTWWSRALLPPIFTLFFFVFVFLSQILATLEAAWEERRPSLFFFTNFTFSQTFRHIFETLHLRWLSHIFNYVTFNYQTTSRWDLPPTGTTIWFIFGEMLIPVYLMI